MPIIIGTRHGTPPPIAREARPLIAMTWTGPDGTVWDLMSADRGVWLTHGIRGLGMPDIDRQTRKSPRGTMWTSFSVGERQVVWNVITHDRDDWVGVDRAFWASLHPARTGVWTVTLPGGERRRLRCRFVDDGDVSFRQDPTITGVGRYQVRLVAEDPFWRGDPITRTFENSTGTGFFGPTGGPPFHIAPAYILGSATITNPGDVEAWPVWTVRGPWTAVTITIDGKTLSVPFTGGSSDVLTIDSDPWRPRAYMQNGADVTGQIASLGFAPIQPGTDVSLGLTLTGTGSVRVDFTPAYLRAF